MDFKEQKRLCRRLAVQHGFTKASEFPVDLMGNESRIQGWLDRMHKPTPFRVPVSPRLINHFPVGADPELVFTNLDNEQIPAVSFQLSAGLSFGMDNNGRLVELRPAPSKFVFDILASTLAELRWMALLRPKTQAYYWVSMPYVGNDGIGGHVHFGRKRDPNCPERLEEISVLDKITNLLTQGEVFNGRGIAARQRNTNYGRPGDVRLQRHGYEYRSMPSWLNTPWLAYLVLVLSKLAVYDPELIKGLQPRSKDGVKKIIHNLLAYYKGRDDDALLAYTALQAHGLPTQTAVDFKQAWGLNFHFEYNSLINFIPDVIDGCEVDREHLYAYLVDKVPVPPYLTAPNWLPSRLPEGYLQIIHSTVTQVRPGMGEIVHDFVTYKTKPVVFDSVDNGKRFIINTDHNIKLRQQQEALRQLIPNAELTVRPDRGCHVYIPKVLRTPELIPKIRQFLTSGFLPVWKGKDVQSDSITKWEATQAVRCRGSEFAVAVPKAPAAEVKADVQKRVFQRAHQWQVNGINEF